MIQAVEPVSLSVGMGVAPEPIGRRAVSEQEVVRFESAMDSPVELGAPVQIHAPDNAVSRASLGHVLQNMVQDIRESQAAHVERIKEAVVAAPEGKEPMEIKDLFGLQLELMQLTFQQDLTAKVADRLSQGVQTLFRNQ
jgi:type III secretion system YscI/HrpB-like protein